MRKQGPRTRSALAQFPFLVLLGPQLLSSPLPSAPQDVAFWTLALHPLAELTGFQEHEVPYLYLFLTFVLPTLPSQPVRLAGISFRGMALGPLSVAATAS